MGKKRSTKELNLSSNERLYLKKNQKKLFKFPLVKNLTTKYANFYTFHAGFKRKLEDLLIVVFNNPSLVATAYSKTSTPSAPIIWDKKNNRGFCKVLIVNSGNANAHTGKEGIAEIEKYVSEASKYFNCSKNQILVSSTGVIGEQIDGKKISSIIQSINNSPKKDLLSASKAIMTTDTYPKTIIKKIKIGKKRIRLFGIAKGSGMIFPKMGTMLAYFFIEANLSKSVLNKILKSHLDSSFNSITVDGDTSTSDTVMLFSLSDNSEKKITNLSVLKNISSVIKKAMHELALQIVCDGEGISKLMKVRVINAKTFKQASSVAFSIANSQLVKTSIAGQDANWGRLIAAIGKSQSSIDQNKIKINYGNNLVAKNGRINKKINLKKLDMYMKNKTIEINVNLGIGNIERTVYSSDLTHEYVRINADYRS